MKICFLAHAGSIHTKHWARYFRDQGHQVSIVSLTPAEEEPGIDLHYVPQGRDSSIERTNWHYLTSLPRMRRVIRDIEPDLVNAHFLSSYGFLGALVRPRDRPFVISLHGSDVLLIPNKSPMHRWAAQFALGRADMITSVAEHMTDLVRPMVGDQKPIITLQYGIDTERFSPPEGDSERGPLCLSTRRLVPLANVSTILAAARILDGQGSPLQFRVVGSGDQREELEELARQWDIRHIVGFAGQVSPDEMADCLREAAIYVSMTSSDGMALSLLEAMACGAFPVVSDIPANREWIADGRNGFLVPLDSPEALAEKLGDAWKKQELRKQAAKRNWETVQEKAVYQKNMSVIESAFIDLLRSKS
jgi:glycosyltransferase involved in cell wall biosynthesis